MRTKLEEFLKTKDTISLEIKDFCQNKENFLSERWEVFLMAGRNRLVTHNPWVETWNTLNDAFKRNVVWFDDFYVERYEEIDVEYILYHMNEINEYKKKGDKDIQFDENAFKEETLEKWIWSFTYYDW